MPRKNGYYWVKVEDGPGVPETWLIAYYHDGRWLINGHSHPGDYVNKVHEDRIKAPIENKTYPVEP